MKTVKNFLRGKIKVLKSDNKITVVASDETLDRHGDVLPIDQWDITKFMMSPRMLVDHNHEVASIVGRWQNVRIDGAKLLMDADFHGITELSKAVKEMVENDYLDTVSVGFIMHGPEKDGGKPSFELIETSWVTVPANPNARVQVSLKTALEAKPSKEQIDDIKNFVKDEDLDSSDDIIPDKPEDADDDEEPEKPKEIEVDSLDSFRKCPAETLKVLCDYKFLAGLIADSEKLLQLTEAGKVEVGEALRSAKVMRLAFIEAAHIVNDTLRKLKK